MLSNSRFNLIEHVASMTKTYQVVNRVCFFFSSKLSNWLDVMHIHTPSLLRFSNTTSLAGISIAFAGQSPLLLPITAIVSIVTAAPAMTLAAAVDCRLMRSCTWDTATLPIIAFINFKRLITENAVSCFSIVGPSSFVVARMRAVTNFCIITLKTISGDIETFSACFAGKFFTVFSLINPIFTGAFKITEFLRLAGKKFNATSGADMRNLHMRRHRNLPTNLTRIAWEGSKVYLVGGVMNSAYPINIIVAHLSCIYQYVALARKRLAQSDPFVHRELTNGMKQLSMFAGATL